MKTFSKFLFALAIGLGMGCSNIQKEAPAPPQSEGYGVNPGSRKYFEYMRHRDPATGEIPRQMRAAVSEFAERLPKKLYDRSVTWTARGPVNKGGRTRSLAIDVQDENILLAGSVSGGLWRSTDGGASWNKSTAPHQMHSVSCIVQDKRAGHEDTWYFGTGEEFYGVVSGTSFTSLYSGDGIYKSTDNGVTWEPLASTTSNTPQNILQNGSYDFIQNMAIDYSNTEEDEVYAAVFNGIIRSTDGGETWSQVLGFTGSGSRYVDLAVTPEGVVYAGFSFANGANQGGVYRSENGIDWTPITPSGWYGQQRLVFCVSPLNSNEVYMIGEMPNNSFSTTGHILYKYTYVSGNGQGAGGIWTNLSSNIPDDDCTLQIGTDFDFGTFRSQNSYDLCIAHHPTQPVLFIGGVNIHRSMSGFTQDDHDWIGGYRCNIENPLSYSYPNHHSDQHWMVFSNSNPNVMYNANDGGVYRTDDVLADSVMWTPLNTGYRTTQFYTLAMEQGYSDSDFIFGGMQDNGTWLTNSDDNLAPWKEVHADDGAFCALPEGHNFIITSSQLGRMYKKTIDENGVLTNTERIDPMGGPQYLFINPLILDGQNHDNIFIAGNRTLWRLPNVSSIPVTGNYINKLPSEFWDNIGESLIPLSAGAITTLDQPVINNDRIYYGSSNGRVFRLDTTYTNPTRTEITSDLFPSNAYTACVSANDLDADEVMVSFSNYSVRSIFHSSDAGETWEDISGNLEQNADGTGNGPAVYWVEIYPSTPQIYFAGTSAGLYSTSVLDGDNTVWEMEGAETIGNVVINMVKARPYDGTLAVATHGNGIYTGSLDPIEAARVEAIGTLTKDVLVFPNPFKENVAWSFSTKKAEQVSVVVYDLKGQKVYEKAYGTLPAGEQRLDWAPASNLPAGTYVYRLKIGNIQRTGKLIYNL